MNENNEILSKAQKKAAEIKEILTNLEDGVYELYPNLNGMSEVWKQFSLIKHSETSQRIDYVHCNECRGLLQFKELSGTSHLLRHKCHFSQDFESAGSKFRNLPLAKIEETQGLLMKNIIKLCTDDFYSYESVCDSTGFLNFLQSFVSLGHKFGNVELRKLYPNVNLIRREVVNMKEEYLRENYSKFREAMVLNYCSATIETRKYKCSSENDLLVMSIQYFDKDLRGLQKKIIFTTSYDTEDAENVQDNIEKSFTFFGGDRNDLVGLKIVTPRTGILSEAFIHPFSRNDCIASTICEILDKSFQISSKAEISELLSNCRSIVRVIMSNDQYRLHLNQDVGTWKSKVAMLQSVIDQYDDVSTILKNENEYKLNFNKRRGEELKSFLEPFVEAVTDLSATTYTTANKILLWWAILKEHLKTHDNYSSEIKSLMMATNVQFESKFRPTITNKIDCFLDPRYKYLKMLSETEKAEVYKEVGKLLDEINVDNEIVVDAPSAPDPKKGRFSLFEGTKSDAKKQKQTNKEKPKSRFSRFESNDTDSKIDDEVSKYMNFPPMTSASFESEFDVIVKYWIPRKKTLPKLFKLVTTRLHVPACCSNDWEKTFAMKENLKPENINDLLIVKDNF